jgi:hypothetical protein
MKTTEPLSPDFSRWLSDSPWPTSEAQKVLAKAAVALESDAEYHTEYAKARFVEDVLQAMADEQVSQSDLARKWGRTRSYLSKVLNEDKRVNFTIETMVELTILLGRKLEINVIDPKKPALAISNVSVVFTDASRPNPISKTLQTACYGRKIIPLQDIYADASRATDLSA